MNFKLLRTRIWSRKARQETGLFLFVFISNVFFLYVHKVILVTTMLDQFSLTAMAVNYTRAQTQHGPLTSQRFVMS